MPFFGCNKLFKVFKIIATTVSIVICGFFLIVFFSTYIIFSFEEKKATAKSNGSQDQAVAIFRISKTSAVAVDPTNFLDKSSENRLAQEHEAARSNRVKLGISFFNEIVKLREDPRLKAALPLCEIVCLRSSWKRCCP